jgi:hypothetical protein
MGQAKRRESEFFSSEQKRLDKWFEDNRPIVVSSNTHGGVSRRKTSSLRRALLISALCGMGAFVTDKDGNRLTI